MQRNPHIGFNRPYESGDELTYISEALKRGHISGDGWYTAMCSELLERMSGARRVLLTTSCTHALEMAAILLDLRQGDEVIMPSFTFVSTANAFTLRGARPVFVDVRPDTLNIDERAIEAAITRRTKAIVVVHYAGVACEMDAIMAIAERHGLVVIEDNAHGIGALYRQRPLGSFGVMSTLSFHETKNIHCGEGGALVINDEQYVERAEILREKGTNRSQFRRGQVDKYTWVDVGSSYLLSDLLAAFLYAQLESLDDIMAKRLEVWNAYYTGLREWSSSNGVALPTVPPHCSHNGHLFYLLLPSESSRDRLIDHMAALDINAPFHYVPLHTSPMGRQVGYRKDDLPVTEDAAARLVRLPVYAGLTEGEVARVLAGLTVFTA